MKNIKKERYLLSFLIFVSIIEGFCSIWATISIPVDSKNSFFFGLSLSRIGILLITIFGICFLVYLIAKLNFIQEWSSNHFTSNKSNRIISGLGILSTLLLWVTIGISTKNFFAYEAVFIRLKSSLIWVELIIFQITFYLKISKNSFSRIDKQFHPEKKIFLGIVFFLFGIWIFITTTKIGLVQKTAFSNVPGIPLSLIQVICVVLFIFLVLIVSSNDEDSTNKPLSKTLIIFIPLLIYSITVIVWGSTPMLKHFFSIQPSQPNFQPFPLSDARSHDLGALSILKGEGIYFHGFTDKPLYMVFLAFLHLFSGNDYVALSWAQICTLALIPVLLYLFGKKYHSPLFGIVLSVLIILQQRNAILLSAIIASVNPKLLVTEELMLLGIILVTYQLFTWMRKHELKISLLLGGVLGALSLIRINPGFIVPAIVLIMYFYLRKKPKILFNQILLFGVGFILVFSPWLFLGVNSEGKSWFFLKIQDVIINRYPIPTEIDEISAVSMPARVDLLNDGVKNIAFVREPAFELKNKENKTVQVDLRPNIYPDKSNSYLVFIMFHHFLHNFSTSLLALPDSVLIEPISELSQREYWQEEKTWDGNLATMQYMIIIINIGLLTIGLVESWKKYRWAGFAPLIIFLAYDLSLSVALNSGSRYIVPINWIIIFYYALGLIFICKIILNILSIKPISETIQVTAVREPEFSRPGQSLFPTFALLVMVASMVPVANLLVPAIVNQSHENNSGVNTMIIPNQNGNQLFYGDILYPYYKINKKTITFEFLSNKVVNTIEIEREFLVDKQVVLVSDLPSVLTYSSLEGKQELEAIYLFKEKQPYLIWQKAH